MPVLELEDFPVPTPVRVDGKHRVHLSDQKHIPPEGEIVVALCGLAGMMVPVELSLEEIDELPVPQKCLRCANAMRGAARIKRLT